MTGEVEELRVSSRPPAPPPARLRSLPGGVTAPNPTGVEVREGVEDWCESRRCSLEESTFTVIVFIGSSCPVQPPRGPRPAGRRSRASRCDQRGQLRRAAVWSVEHERCHTSPWAGPGQFGGRPLVPFGSERRTLAPGESCATRPSPESGCRPWSPAMPARPWVQRWLWRNPQTWVRVCWPRRGVHPPSGDSSP